MKAIKTVIGVAAITALLYNCASKPEQKQVACLEMPYSTTVTYFKGINSPNKIVIRDRPRRNFQIVKIIEDYDRSGIIGDHEKDAYFSYGNAREEYSLENLKKSLQDDNKPNFQKDKAILIVQGKLREANDIYNDKLKQLAQVLEMEK